MILSEHVLNINFLGPDVLSTLNMPFHFLGWGDDEIGYRFQNIGEI